MAGAMRKMGIYLGLVEDDERRAEHDYADEDYAAEPEQDAHYGSVDTSHDRPSRYAADAPEAPAPVRRTRPSERAARSAWASTPTSGATVLAARAAAPAAESSYRITTLHPRTYNEARTIGEHFREGVPVIMNLTEMDDSDAKRLVDFAAGLSFGLRGSIERVTNKVFLLSPQNVSVTAEDRAKIVEGGFFNQS